MIEYSKARLITAGLFNLVNPYYTIRMDFILDQLNKEISAKGAAYLRIKVRPGAGKTAVRGSLDTEEGQTIKIDVAAPAERGKANEELIRYLARELDVTKDRVKIISGFGDKVKLVKVTK